MDSLGALDRFANAGRETSHDARSRAVRAETTPGPSGGATHSSIGNAAARLPGALEMFTRSIFELDDRHYLRRVGEVCREKYTAREKLTARETDAHRKSRPMLNRRRPKRRMIAQRVSI